ncbi:COMM domain-containing protein 3 isoform X1 [Oncorhynchus mykiss]|uniref:COMM domain-containing protein 3 isoform X1 n=1 Tax=Oncorhynchus kisutch TaxID=8019 RepID=UPI00099FEE57|nr:COMM domain-containing protein 3 isoform X1 [Oncorhynchus kisutch]XP_021417884.1 COMM domain-containing protein 3 isoform X1 [Oncorhynchus mykiss]XP_035624114.1 COMM domain-containing protein 3-like isoform X1 [Oncorhynchus keta]
MELSESVQKGLQSLADATFFDMKTFSVFIEVAFRSLLSAHADRSVLDQPEFKRLDQKLLKHCHTAATTCILEGVKQNADKSTISACLEDVGFDAERTEVFYTTYQKCRSDLETLLSSLGRCPPHINDVSWRLEYCIKNGHVHKVNEPSYLISLNVEPILLQNANNGGSSEDLHFSCTMEQLQDLVGKMKDAAKSLEKATQL